MMWLPLLTFGLTFAVIGAVKKKINFVITGIMFIIASGVSAVASIL